MLNTFVSCNISIRVGQLWISNINYAHLLPSNAIFDMLNENRPATPSERLWPYSFLLKDVCYFQLNQIALYSQHKHSMSQKVTESNSKWPFGITSCLFYIGFVEQLKLNCHWRFSIKLCLHGYCHFKTVLRSNSHEKKIILNAQLTLSIKTDWRQI